MKNINEKELAKKMATATGETIERNSDARKVAIEAAKGMKEKQSDDDLFASINRLISLLDDNKGIASLKDVRYITCNQFSMKNTGNIDCNWSQLADISMLAYMPEKSKFGECEKTYAFDTDNNLIDSEIDNSKYPLIIVGKKKEFWGKCSHYEYPWILCESKEEYEKVPEDIEIMGAFSVRDDLYDTMMKKINITKEKMEAQRNRHIFVKGDIIITDPCYIVKDRDESTAPKWEDFHPYKSMMEYPDYDKDTDSSVSFMENGKRLDEAYRKWDKEHPEDRNDWNNYDLSKFGIYTFLSRETMVGDWSCITINSDTKEKIGEFCADGGEVGVFLLEEVLKYNPSFDYHIDRPWTTTLIKDFEGEIWMEEDKKLECTRVIGKGNINFETKMVGF